MNGIRLAVFAVAAICFFQLQVSEVTAQGPGPGYEEYQRKAQKAMQDAMNGSLPDQESRGASKRGSSKSSKSRSRRNNSRRSSNSNNGDNAIKSNPLLQLFDENGDGELSLEEIDAASRLLYSLDTNEDNRITADEVEDMVAPGADRGRTARNDAPEREPPRSRERSSTPPRSASGRRGKIQAAPGPGGAGASRGPSRGASAMGISPMGTNARGGDDPNAEDFEANDRNEDGILKRGELPKSLRSDFRKMDKNGDGGVDEDEFYEFIDG